MDKLIADRSEESEEDSEENNERGQWSLMKKWSNEVSRETQQEAIEEAIRIIFVFCSFNNTIKNPICIWCQDHLNNDIQKSL